MKVSLITVVYNAERYIEDCIQSVLAQTYSDIEYIIIDGGSTDRTLAIIEKYKDRVAHFSSGKDKGMYDALNKGIALASGEVIGILNADDMLASKVVIEKIAKAFDDKTIDAIYGDLNYVDAVKTSKVIRRWVGKPYTLASIKMGWMPAHPTLYIRRSIFNRLGRYSLDFGTAADYELMLRFLYRNQIKAVYVNELIVNMRVGGMSNAGYKERVHALIQDYHAIKANGLPFALLTVAFKKLSKLPQFFT